MLCGFVLGQQPDVHPDRDPAMMPLDEGWM